MKRTPPGHKGHQGRIAVCKPRVPRVLVVQFPFSAPCYGDGNERRAASPSPPARYAAQIEPSAANVGYPRYSLTSYERPVKTGSAGSLNVALHTTGDDANALAE